MDFIVKSFIFVYIINRGFISKVEKSIVVFMTSVREYC